MKFFMILMFIFGFIFLMLGMLIYQGNTYLIHDYHQNNVKEEEKVAYGKAFSKGTFGIGISFILSGIISLFHVSESIITGVLIFGIFFSVGMIVTVQKKYNGGIFS